MSESLPLNGFDENGQFLPEIRRGRYNRLTIYEVEAAELELIERGGPDSLLLNFAVALLSVAVSLAATLATSSIDSDRVFQFFCVVMVLCFILGAPRKTSSRPLLVKLQRPESCCCLHR